MAMPTLQQIIGTITGKIAFERTQANFTIIKDAHNGLDTSLATHKAESVQQIILATRDLSLAGVQTISGLTGIPKSIEVFATLNSEATPSSSVGVYTPTSQFVTAIYKGASSIPATFSGNGNVIFAFNIGTVFSIAALHSVTASKFDLTWVKTGSPVGTINLQFVITYHGGN